MKYTDFNIEIPKFLEGWRHTLEYCSQSNPCSTLTLGHYEIIVFVGTDENPNEFDIYFKDWGDTIGAGGVQADTEEEAVKIINRLIKADHKSITASNYESIARGV